MATASSEGLKHANNHEIQFLPWEAPRPVCEGSRLQIAPSSLIHTVLFSKNGNITQNNKEISRTIGQLIHAGIIPDSIVPQDILDKYHTIQQSGVFTNWNQKTDGYLNYIEELADVAYQLLKVVIADPVTVQELRTIVNLNAKNFKEKALPIVQQRLENDELKTMFVTLGMRNKDRLVQLFVNTIISRKLRKENPIEKVENFETIYYKLFRKDRGKIGEIEELGIAIQAMHQSGILDFVIKNGSGDFILQYLDLINSFQNFPLNNTNIIEIISQILGKLDGLINYSGLKMDKIVNLALLKQEQRMQIALNLIERVKNNTGISLVYSDEPINGDKQNIQLDGRAIPKNITSLLLPAFIMNELLIEGF